MSARLRSGRWPLAWTSWPWRSKSKLDRWSFHHLRCSFCSWFEYLYIPCCLHPWIHLILLDHYFWVKPLEHTSHHLHLNSQYFRRNLYTLCIPDTLSIRRGRPIDRVHDVRVFLRSFHEDSRVLRDDILTRRWIRYDMLLYPCFQIIFLMQNRLPPLNRYRWYSSIHVWYVFRQPY